jgi:hypothetical protein
LPSWNAVTASTIGRGTTKTKKKGAGDKEDGEGEKENGLRRQEGKRGNDEYPAKNTYKKSK